MKKKNNDNLDMHPLEKKIFFYSLGIVAFICFALMIYAFIKGYFLR